MDSFARSSGGAGGPTSLATNNRYVDMLEAIAPFVVVNFLLSLIIANIAYLRGVSWGGYFLLSLFFTPVLALPVLLIHAHSRAHEAEKMTLKRRMPTPRGSTYSPTR
jgi:hypothetical protein